MSLNLGVMSAAVTLDDADYRKKLSGLEGASSRTFKRIAAAAAGYLTARALFGFVSGAMSEFSKLEEGNNKLKYTFTELQGEAQRAAATIASTFGLSAQTATNAIANIGDLLTGLGFKQAEALNFAKSITERGIDVASFKGLDQTETIRRMTVALTGETESLKSIGIVIRQGSDEFRGQVKAIMAATGATETQAKAQVILQEIMKQTSTAAGDYLRPDAPRTYQQEVTDLTEAMRRFKAEIGASAQPITQEMVVKARELLTWYNELTPSARSLTHATAGLASAMLILTNTKFGKSIMGAGKTSSAEDVEAAKFKANEEVKRAETEMTTAQMEENLAKQNLQMAKNAVAAAENAEAFAQGELVKAQATGDMAKIEAAQAALLASQKNVTEAKLKESKATTELQAKTVAANTAAEKYRAVSAALPGVLKEIAASSTLAGKASIFMSGGFRAAGVAIKGFFASLGPVGWAILAAAVAFEAASVAIDMFNGGLEESAQKAKEAADAAAEVTAKNHDDNAAKVGAMNRLAELQKYESLNNAEREEAKRLLAEVGIAYDENGKSIDEMISRQGEEKRSLAELIKMRKEELKQKRIAALEEQIQKNIQAAEANDEKKVGAWGTFGRAAVSLGYWTGEGKNAEIQAESQKFYEANNKLRQELYQLREDEIEVGETEDDRNRKNAEAAENQRKALEQLTDKEWNIKFNASSVDEQIAMLTGKMDTVFNEYKRTGKYQSIDQFKSADRDSMTEQELKDLQQIVELENQRATINKRIADEKQRELDNSAKAFEYERESYDRMLADRQKQQQNNAVERELKQAQQSGDKTSVDAIMQRELEKAREAAKTMQRQYEQAVQDAEADKILTEEEKKRISDLKREMQRAMSDEYKWSDRIGSEKQDEENRKTAVAWSSEILNSMLGSGKNFDQQTAKNTKEQVKVMKEVRDGIGKLNDKDNSDVLGD